VIWWQKYRGGNHGSSSIAGMAGSQITAVNVGGDAASVGHGTIAVPQ
jgi:hypothetical protein